MNTSSPLTMTSQASVFSPPQPFEQSTEEVTATSARLDPYRSVVKDSFDLDGTYISINGPLGEDEEENIIEEEADNIDLCDDTF